MVYGTIKQSGGHIWVYSEPGQGTSFKIYLPRVEGEPAQAQPAPVLESGGDETILLVEDEASVRSFAERVLSKHGYSVISAADAPSALEAARRHHGTIHVLLTDIVMPGMSGPQLARRLLALRPATRVLYMTGYTEDTVVRHVVGRPESAYLEKPFRPELLLARVRQVLE